jgi:hypothetical protein
MYSKASTNYESNRCKDYQTYFKIKQENSSDYEGVKDENGGLASMHTRNRKNKRK